MAKNAWGDEIAPKDEAGGQAAESGRDWGDRPAAQRELPAKVAASAAGAGRGATANDPRRLDAPEPAPQGDPMGSGVEAMLAQPTRPDTVLEGVVLPEPTVTPGQEAEAARLSRREYAERTTQPGAPAGPAATAGAPQRPNRAEDAGRLAGDTGPVGRVASKIAASGAEGAWGVVRAGAELVGADKVASVAKGAAEAAQDFDRGMGKPQALSDFNPRGPMPYLQEQAEGAATSLGQSALYATAFGARAVIPLLSLQSAGQQYQAARAAGKTPGQALANAIPYGAFEALGEKFQGLDKAAKALNVITGGRATRQQIKDAGQILIEAGVKEIPGELVTYLGQTAVDVLPGIGIRNDLTTEQFLEGLRDTVVQSAMMGTAMGAGGAAARMRAASPPRELTAEEIAREKDFLAQRERIKALSGSGEKEVAGVLQRRLDTEQAESELANLSGTPYGADPDFQQRYRTMRSQGVKPAEASSRAAMVSGFAQLGAQAGLSPKAVDRAIEQAAKMPLDEVPEFLERFTAGLAQRGMGAALPEGTVAGAVGAVGDDAMNTAVTNIERLLGINQAGGSEVAKSSTSAAASPQTPLSASGQGNGETSGEPAELVTKGGDSIFDPGNDVRVTPETDAVHAAATSPLNDRPEPTQAQKEAGNYAMGHVKVAGLDISVENPQGSVRRGTDASGKPWETPMRDHYGYIKGTVGADKDHIDVFVKPGTPADFRGPVFVVDQVDPATGKFDEAKVVVGATDQAEAEQIYRRNYTADWQGLGAITQLPLPAFQAWARSNGSKEPLGDLSHIQPRAPASQQAAAGAAAASPAPNPAAAGAPAEDRAAGTGQAGTPADGARTAPAADVAPDPVQQRRDFAEAEKKRKAKGARLRAAAVRKNPLMAFLGKHGIQLEYSKQFAPGRTERKAAMASGFAPIFRRSGLAPDELALRAVEEGFLLQPDFHQITDMIHRALSGERIVPQYAEGVAEEEMERQLAEHEEPAPDEAAAIEALADLEDNELAAVEDLLDDVPDLDAADNVSLEEAMRLLGFTEQEISDAVAKQSGVPQAHGAGRGDAGQAAAAQAPGPDRGRESAPPAAKVAAPAPTETPASAGVSSSTSLKRQVVDLRKRVAVLRALRDCVKG